MDNHEIKLWKAISIAFGVVIVCVFLFWMLNQLMKGL